MMHRFVALLSPLAIVLISGAIVLPKPALGQAGGLEIRKYVVDGTARYARVHIPPEAHQRPCPIIFVYHGHDGTVEQAVKEFSLHTRWPKAIVVYPKGIPTPAGNDPEGKQTGWQYRPGEVGDRDVKFFDAMLAALREEVKVDEKRVYAVGFSNGGGFTFVLWAERVDQISAVVSCAMIAPKKLIETFKPKPLAV